MPSGKNFKCWGTSYGVIGDLIMSLPILTYMEKKFPGSYKYFVIEKKVAFTAPLYLNHPLIDCIRITGEWDGFSEEDYKIASTCEFKCTMDDWRHDEIDWFNHRGQVEETARIAGIYDLKEWLTEEEMMPKLYQWFDLGIEESENTYARENDSKAVDYSKTIAIWPFASSARNMQGRNPTVEWWATLTEEICKMGIRAIQFGHKSEKMIPCPNVKDYTHLSFFEQVKIALACKMSIGTDSGNMWVMGAYCHPAIHLMTSWLMGHSQNRLTLAPVNKNGTILFDEDSCDNIKHDSVLEEIERKMKI
ncbi:MAG: hypothetical protein ACUZ8I_05100 [Candidatus Scalindua sp.]